MESRVKSESDTSTDNIYILHGHTTLAATVNDFSLISTRQTHLELLCALSTVELEGLAAWSQDCHPAT